MKRLAVLSVPAAAAALGAVILVPGAGSAQTGGGQTIKLVESGNGSFKFLDNPPKATRKRGPSSGDELIFANRLTDASGKAAGTLLAKCTFTPKPGTLLCEGVFKLASGTITGAALTTESSRTTVIAITGGTGAYRNVRGQMDLKYRNPAGTEFDFVFHLIG